MRKRGLDSCIHCNAELDLYQLLKIVLIQIDIYALSFLQLDA